MSRNATTPAAGGSTPRDSSRRSRKCWANAKQLQGKYTGTDRRAGAHARSEQTAGGRASVAIHRHPPSRLKHWPESAVADGAGAAYHRARPYPFWSPHHECSNDRPPHRRRPGLCPRRRRECRLPGSCDPVCDSLRTGRRIGHRGALAGASVQGKVRTGDDRHQQARRGRRPRMVADEQHAGRRLHDRRRQSPAHRAAAARGRGQLQDRGRDAGAFLPLHAGCRHRVGRQPVQDAGRSRESRARKTRGHHVRGFGNQLGESCGA